MRSCTKLWTGEAFSGWIMRDGKRYQLPTAGNYMPSAAVGVEHVQKSAEDVANSVKHWRTPGVVTAQTDNVACSGLTTWAG